jgi:hypothetical protein
VKKKVRPHPGPLPQERETRRALEKFVNSMAVGGTLTVLWTREPVRTRIKWDFFERRPVR